MEWLMPDEDSKYTKSDLKIMEFIENYTDEFLFMSIGQLAKRLDVPEATISRFARHVGYRDLTFVNGLLTSRNASNGHRTR